MRARRSIAVLSASLAYSICGAQESAPPVTPVAPVATIAPVQLDAAEVEKFVDGQVIPALKTSGVPGAVVAVVRRDRVVLAKGYGIADVGAGTPVRADRTLFETASIGKTMTAIVALQLVEEGRLDLDTDVNRYLKSGTVCGGKVTLRTLLTHRAGFDDDLTGLFVPFDGDTSMSKAELDRRLVTLVPPGHATAYDNQGYGVVGLILRDITGKSLPQLFRDRIFDPTGMTGAVLGRPADARARLARCYTVQGPGAVQECEFWLYRDGLMGAGGVAASGNDMARYMRMLLNGGSLDGRQVLSPAAFADLTNFDHYRFHPGMPGGGFSFIQFEEFRGLEYAHSGHMPGFSSMMTLFPDADVAIFSSFLGGPPGSFDMTLSNLPRAIRETSVEPGARKGFETLNQLNELIAERFIPANRPRSNEIAAGAPDSAATIDSFTGRYVVGSAHSRSFVTRLGGFGSVIEVERVGEKSIRFGGALAVLGEYHSLGSLLFENDKKQRVAFAQLPIGRYMAVGLSGGVFRKTNWVETPTWTAPVALVSLIVLLSAAVQLRRKANVRVRQLAALTLCGFVLVLAGLLAEFQWGVTQGVVQGSILLPALWRLALHVGAAMLVWAAVRYFRSRQPVPGRIAAGHGALLAVSGVGLFLVLLFWRVLGAFPPYVSW